MAQKTNCVLTSTFVGANVEMAVFVSLLLLFTPEHLATVFALVLAILLAGLVAFILIVLLDDAEWCTGCVRRKCLVNFRLVVWLNFRSFQAATPTAAVARLFAFATFRAQLQVDHWLGFDDA